MLGLGFKSLGLGFKFDKFKPTPYPNTKHQPNLKPNLTTWEVEKEVNVLLNAKTVRGFANSQIRCGSKFINFDP